MKKIVLIILLSLIGLFGLILFYEEVLVKNNYFNINAEIEPDIIYLCPDGYVDNGVSCEKQVVEQSHISYFCKDGYKLDGAYCVMEQTYSAYSMSYCPSGYQELLNGSCRSTDERLGNYKYYCYSYSRPIILYNKQCYIELGTDPLYGQVGGTCVHGTVTPYGIVSFTSYCRYYSVTNALKELECPIGYSKYNNIHTNTQWCQSDKKIAKEIKYYCSGNDLLIGNQCKRTNINNANIKYYCINGQLGSDNNCYYTDVIDKYPVYKCSSGYRLEGSTCIRE